MEDKKSPPTFKKNFSRYFNKFSIKATVGGHKSSGCGFDMFNKYLERCKYTIIKSSIKKRNE